MIKQQSAISHQLSAISIKKAGRAGFTLIELLITMTIFVLAIAAASQIFTGLLTQFKQQSKIAETNIEGIIGLEMMRRDIEHAGYGLPWVIDAAVAYNEAAAAEAAVFNDCSGTAPCNPPRAIVSGNNMTTYASPNNVFNGSDYLAIKAVNVATSAAAQRWTRLRTGNDKRTWGTTADDFVNTDRVIVISPGTSDATRQSLVVSGAWWTTYGNTGGFAPADAAETRFIYGIDPDTNLRMPFNRADYYIWRAGTTVANDGVPDRCALRTGILRKAVIAHADGDRIPLPLLDCVADMQVTFWRDTDGDGDIDWSPSDDISSLTAQQIREQVREVRVYIIAHEGQKDITYDFSMGDTREYLSTTEVLDANSRTINFVNLKTLVGDPDYKYYRWKLYTLVVKPNNLR